MKESSYWKKFNSPAESKEKIKKWVFSLPPTWKYVLIYALAIMGMLIALAIIPTPPHVGLANKTTTTQTPSDRLGIPKVTIPHIELPKIEITPEYVGIKRVKPIEYPISVEEIMCNYIYRYNQTNITWSKTTCYRWEDTVKDLNHECLCITPA